MRKCINCSYEGNGPFNPKFHCPVCGDNTEGDEIPQVQSKEVKLDYDINNDGKVDQEDVSLMAKKLGSKGGRKAKGAIGKRSKK